ncbi:MORN repeat-containing protein 3-like [Hyposmocoma kahamanoa]|uniref:MORN repeat-containing protein 3-like n=1 Tax=Hyposmocoma kahamanoa TaxID=1477025 RepID=UPI000E6D6EFB|nr:MORN repeat-containing protein 3-like [Hyposmocoma kahamanoa]
MPFYRRPRNFTPLSTLAEKRSHKNGVHHAIFTARFDRYVGDWQKDLKHGKGVFLTNGYDGGRLYEGDWYQGFRHGNGTLSYRQENGVFKLQYSGDWVRGKPEGIGRWWYENGDVYFGFWNKGKRHGFGKMWYADDTYFVGYWAKGDKNGPGMFVYQNSDRYEGNWKNDEKNGLGRYYHMNTGQLQEGCWVNNICVNSKMSDIIIRQFCQRPTPYPIFNIELQDPRELLEESTLWKKLTLGEIDKNLKTCIDQIY